MTRVVIDRLLIRGLQGRAPTRGEVDAAVRQALATQAPRNATPGPAHRVEQPPGTTLTGATQAVVAAVSGAKPR